MSMSTFREIPELGPPLGDLTNPSTKNTEADSDSSPTVSNNVLAAGGSVGIDRPSSEETAREINEASSERKQRGHKDNNGQAESISPGGSGREQKMGDGEVLNEMKGEKGDKREDAMAGAARTEDTAGAPAEIGAGGGSLKRVGMDEKFGFFHPQLKKPRTKALKILLLLFILMAIWAWACLSFFWGSTYLIEALFPNLTFFLIPLDTSAQSYLNSPLISAAKFENTLPASTPHVTWIIRNASDYPNGLQGVRDDIVAQRCWAALVINSNASTSYLSALENGNSSYDPTGSMGFYYSSSRFYQVVLLYFLPILTEFIAEPLAMARASALASFVQSYQGNQTALELAREVPQAIGVGFGYTLFDVRPIKNNQWSGAAPMEAGLIYFVIFAFYNALYAAQGRLRFGFAPKILFSSMLKIRLLWPLFCYFWMSLAFTTIERAWQIPMENFLGRAGFPTLWALNFVTIWAGGWAMETVTALIGPMNLPFFLILWIIMNVTSSFFPIELMTRFYRFLYAMPFHHNIEAFKIIAYGANLQHRLGLHFGVLFAIIGVECIGFSLALIFERWKMDRGMTKAAAAKREKESQQRAEP